MRVASQTGADPLVGVVKKADRARFLDKIATRLSELHKTDAAQVPFMEAAKELYSLQIEHLARPDAQLMQEGAHVFLPE